MKILVIIPAYNEEGNILTTIKDLELHYPEMDRIVVNDASKDRTKEILKRSNIPFIDLPINLGIGGGVQTGYKYALDNDYDIAIQMDGDGQHCAQELGKLIEPIKNNEANIVVGSRFITNEGFQSSFLRRIGIRFLSGLIKLCTGYKIHDVTSGFRAVDKRFIKIYAEEYAQDYPEPEALIVGAKYGAKIIEVPTVMRERINGESSIASPFKSIYYMIKVSLSIIMHKLSM